MDTGCPNQTRSSTCSHRESITDQKDQTKRYLKTCHHYPILNYNSKPTYNMSASTLNLWLYIAIALIQNRGSVMLLHQHFIKLGQNPLTSSNLGGTQSQPPHPSNLSSMYHLHNTQTYQTIIKSEWQGTLKGAKDQSRFLLDHQTSATLILLNILCEQQLMVLGVGCWVMLRPQPPCIG